jgi:hypothetical protein
MPSHKVKSCKDAYKSKGDQEKCQKLNRVKNIKHTLEEANDTLKATHEGTVKCAKGRATYKKQYERAKSAAANDGPKASTLKKVGVLEYGKTVKGLQKCGKKH